MRVVPAVEEEEVPGLRPDDGAVPLDGLQVRRCRVMSDDQLAAGRWSLQKSTPLSGLESTWHSNRMDGPQLHV